MPRAVGPGVDSLASRQEQARGDDAPRAASSTVPVHTFNVRKGVRARQNSRKQQNAAARQLRWAVARLEEAGVGASVQRLVDAVVS